MTPGLEVDAERLERHQEKWDAGQHVWLEAWEEKPLEGLGKRVDKKDERP